MKIPTPDEATAWMKTSKDPHEQALYFLTKENLDVGIKEACNNWKVATEYKGDDKYPTEFVGAYLQLTAAILVSLMGPHSKHQTDLTCKVFGGFLEVASERSMLLGLMEILGTQLQKKEKSK